MTIHVYISIGFFIQPPRKPGPPNHGSTGYMLGVMGVLWAFQLTPLQNLPTNVWMIISSQTASTRPRQTSDIMKMSQVDSAQLTFSSYSLQQN